MLERSTVTPAFGIDNDLTQDQVLAHLLQWRADTASTLETVKALRLQAEQVTRQLENPKAAAEYLDFFGGMFERVLADLDRVIAELPGGFTIEHADALRQIASNGAVEQRRTLLFRDKWVNKPLPYEQVRPMLTQIATDVREQLNDYKELTLAASRLAQLVPPTPPAPGPTPEERGFDRRALFKKIVGPLGNDEDKA